VLLIAPHPDDEVLGAGALLARAARVGATMNVVFVTDGENNPWAQRASELRIVVGAEARMRFGARRRREALASLARLGHREGCATFLGLPDQGLTRILLHEPGLFVDRCRSIVQRLAPTHLVVPSAADLHPDHSAAAVLARLALEPENGPDRRTWLSYLIHHPALSDAAPVLARFVPTEAERATKLAALRCHRSQRVLRGVWMARFADRDERFSLDITDPRAGHPVRFAGRGTSGFALEIASSSRPGAFGRRTLLLVIAVPGRPPLSLSASLPRSARSVTIRATSTGEAVAEAAWSGTGRQGRLVLPAESVPPEATVFAKLERRFGFFDEAGWTCAWHATPGDTPPAKA